MSEETKEKVETVKKAVETKAESEVKTYSKDEYNALKSQLDSMQLESEKKERNYQKKIADMQFNFALDNAISFSKARNSKAVKSLLDIDALKSSKNQTEDIKKALEKVRSENDYLFESSEPVKNPVAPTNNPSISGISKAIFNKMGYIERLKLKKENPDKYNEMKGE